MSLLRGQRFSNLFVLGNFHEEKISWEETKDGTMYGNIIFLKKKIKVALIQHHKKLLIILKKIDNFQKKYIFLLTPKPVFGCKNDQRLPIWL